MKPLLSIVIPTKNRYKTLIPVVNAILKYVQYSNYELILQDNSDCNEEILVFLKNLNDTKVKYYYNNDVMSLTQNTICSIENAQGDYLTFIGDDDLVSPYIGRITEYLKNKNINCLTYNCGYYWWDSVSFIKETYYHRNNALWIPDDLNFDFKEYDSKKELDFVINNGGVHFFNLPRFYHGIIKRELLEKIRNISGTYLIGSCPDISFSTSLALVVDKYYYLNYPVTIYGASKNSGGGMSANKTHYGQIKDQPFLQDNIIDVWDDNIPKIWSAQTIYAQTVSEVLSTFKYSKKINYEAFFGSILVYEPFLLKYIIPVLVKYSKGSLKIKGRVLLIFLKKYIGVLFRKLLYRFRGFKYKVVIAKNVDECMRILTMYKYNQ